MLQGFVHPKSREVLSRPSFPKFPKAKNLLNAHHFCSTLKWATDTKLVGLPAWSAVHHLVGGTSMITISGMTQNDLTPSICRFLGWVETSMMATTGSKTERPAPHSPVRTLTHASSRSARLPLSLDAADLAVAPDANFWGSPNTIQ